MALPPPDIEHAAIVSALYIQALREGRSQSFRIVSGSMRPLLHIGDTVNIIPAHACDIRIGEIVAFETPDGLVVHRALHRQQTGESVRLLQMGDSEVRPGWLPEAVVVGRIIAIQRDTTFIDLQMPIAKWWEAITARMRYQLYLRATSKLEGIVLRVCSRLVLRLGCWCIYRFCRTSVA